MHKPYAGNRKKQRSEEPEPDPEEKEDSAGSQWDMSSVVPPVPNHYGSAGLQRLSETNRALDAFTLYFDDQVMEHIVDQTNLYVEQTHWKWWAGLTQDELRAYFGVLVLMSVNPWHQVDMYWSTDSLFRAEEIAAVRVLQV